MASSAAQQAPAPGEPAVYSLKVSLCGEPVQVRSDQPLEVVQKIAGYLNRRMQEAGGTGAGAASDKFRLLALAALSVTGELFEAKARLEEDEKTRHSMLARAQSLTDSLDRALAARGNGE